MQSRTTSRELALLILGQISDAESKLLHQLTLDDLLQKALDSLLQYWREGFDNCAEELENAQPKIEENDVVMINTGMHHKMADTDEYYAYSPGLYKEAAEWLHLKGDSEVDALRDWFLVSQLQLGGEPWAEVLIARDTDIGVIEVTKARGIKCERCWHFETDIGSFSEHPTLCGRCVNVLSK